MARFRCCGSYTTEGHADDCSLKPPKIETEQKPHTEDAGEGCRFDILHFKHIGECKGTCDGGEGVSQDGIGQFAESAETQSGKLVIVLIDLAGATEEEIAELEELGLKRLTAEEMEDIMEAVEAGELEIEIQTLTVAEAIAKAKQRKTKPDPYLDIHQAAELLGFSDGWTRTLCRNGRFEGAIKLDRQWAIPESTLLMEDDE